MSNGNAVLSTSAASPDCLDTREGDDRLLEARLTNAAAPTAQGSQDGFARASSMVRTALRGTSYISVEQQWRRVDGAIGAVNEFGAHVLASRWKREEDTSLDVSSETGQDVHTLAIILTPTRMTFWHAGHTLFDGCAMPGITQVTAPRQYVCATFHSHCDVLHLHMSQPLLHECYQGTFGCEHQGDILIHRTEPVRDVTMERLGVALVHADDTRAAFGRLFFDSVGLAIVSRLLARELAEEALAPARPNATALQPWRVRRVIEYIDANLSDAIRLADLARVTGLSRMHFASQFRAATGFTPHEFLVRTRIERAQALLRHSDQSTFDIAHNAGFKSQSNFTAVFKQMVGETPSQWRRALDCRSKSVR